MKNCVHWIIWSGIHLWELPQHFSALNSSFVNIMTMTMNWKTNHISFLTLVIVHLAKAALSFQQCFFKLYPGVIGCKIALSFLVFLKCNTSWGERQQVLDNVGTAIAKRWLVETCCNGLYTRKISRNTTYEFLAVSTGTKFRTQNKTVCHGLVTRYVEKKTLPQYMYLIKSQKLTYYVRCNHNVNRSIEDNKREFSKFFVNNENEVPIDRMKTLVCVNIYTFCT